MNEKKVLHKYGKRALFCAIIFWFAVFANLNVCDANPSVFGSIFLIGSFLLVLLFSTISFLRYDYKDRIYAGIALIITLGPIFVPIIIMNFRK